MRYLTPEAARAFYDRFSLRQDGQAWYEDPAVAAMTAHARFGEARAVFELGAGTGRLARRLLSRELSPATSYTGVELSATMLGIARERLAEWGDRARMIPSDGSLSFDFPDGSFDRFVSTYVLDLLSPGMIREALREAHRLLEPGGLLCLAGLTHGRTIPERLLEAGWLFLHRLSPRLVGGCRPVDLLKRLPPEDWQIEHHAVTSVLSITSQSVVARRN